MNLAAVCPFYPFNTYSLPLSSIIEILLHFIKNKENSSFQRYKLGISYQCRHCEVNSFSISLRGEWLLFVPRAQSLFAGVLVRKFCHLQRKAFAPKNSFGQIHHLWRHWPYLSFYTLQTVTNSAHKKQQTVAYFFL